MLGVHALCFGCCHREEGGIEGGNVVFQEVAFLRGDLYRLSVS
jgi:hypothetical protein